MTIGSNVSRRSIIFGAAAMAVVTVIVLAAAVAVSHWRRPIVAACYTGTATTPRGEHRVAELRLALYGRTVSATYLTGPTLDAAQSYDVTGTLHRGTFTGTFWIDDQAVPAAGTVDRSRIVLTGGQQLLVTTFTADCAPRPPYSDDVPHA